MKPHEQILKMIEQVDPIDTAKLDEIDARVFGYVNSLDLSKSVTITPYSEDAEPYERTNFEWAKKNAPSYTRSRDALKAIRPKGWVWEMATDLLDRERPARAHATLYADLKTKKTLKKIVNARGPIGFPTEELAELHAIIQAIAYERNQQCV